LHTAALFRASVIIAESTAQVNDFAGKFQYILFLLSDPPVFSRLLPFSNFPFSKRVFSPNAKKPGPPSNTLAGGPGPGFGFPF